MKLLGEDGYVKPQVQIGCALGAALCSLVLGIWNLVAPDTAFDRPFGVFLLLGVPFAIYIAWHGYRKMRSQPTPPKNPGPDSVPTPRRFPLIVLGTGVLSAPVFSWLMYRTATPGWIAVTACTATIIFFITFTLLVWRAVVKRQNQLD